MSGHNDEYWAGFLTAVVCGALILGALMTGFKLGMESERREIRQQAEGEC